MARSQNGWTANDPSTVSRRPVPGTQVGLTVCNGTPGDLLLEVAAQFDRQVQDIDNARGALDDWGYAERPIRGGTQLSNHASGTAIDLNATKWPLGKPASVNLSPAQIATVRRIVAATGGVVRWGGDYTGRKDAMHFELGDATSPADCVRALTRLRTAYPSEDDMPSLDDVRKVVREELTKSALAKRDDVGFARNQILTALGVGNPEKAPTSGGVTDVRIEALTAAIRGLADVMRELAARE